MPDIAGGETGINSRKQSARRLYAGSSPVFKKEWHRMFRESGHSRSLPGWFLYVLIKKNHSPEGERRWSLFGD